MAMATMSSSLCRLVRSILGSSRVAKQSRIDAPPCLTTTASPHRSDSLILYFYKTLIKMRLPWGATGGAVTRQGAFNLGGLSEENWIRVQEQNEKPISVIIGNPPYNANQQNENDNNKNREYPEIDRRISDTYIAASTAQKTRQYDIYKRFIRWASDRLADDGIIALITNRAYLDAKQDDGFRQIAAREFSDLYILDLGSDVRRNPKISGTMHNVFGIQTGVAIGFFVREKSTLGKCAIHYARRQDAEVATDKLAYLREAKLDEIEFENITPDDRNDWLNQSNSDFASLIPLANRQTKLTNTVGVEQAVFGLYSMAVATNRDDWVYDFDISRLRGKALFFADTYNALGDSGEEPNSAAIKWSEATRSHFNRGRRIVYSEQLFARSLYRPFVVKQYFADVVMNDRLTSNHYEMFGFDLRQPNKVMNFCVNGRYFYTLVADKLTDLHFTGDTQCLPLYRYTDDGERVSNITQWGIDSINGHYRREWGDDFETLTGPDGITAEEIFAYTYAVLHDPAYRHEYAVDLLREFPCLPLYQGFHHWAEMGQTLLDLHIGFESAEPYPLQLVEQAGEAKRVLLRADKDGGRIVLDDKSSLTGVPDEAWEYRLGSRSALEWVLDQYKEKKPRDPTILAKFNTYRFADHKERVIELLQRVCTVSVETVRTVERLARLSDVDPE